MDFQSAMETFAEAWVASQVRSGFQAGSSSSDINSDRERDRETPVESRQQQLASGISSSNKGSGGILAEAASSLCSDYPNKISGMDLTTCSSSSTTAATAASGTSSGAPFCSSSPSQATTTTANNSNGNMLSSSSSSPTSLKRPKGVLVGGGGGAGGSGSGSRGKLCSSSPDFHSSSTVISNSPTSTSNIGTNPNTTSASLGKSMPIHCIIEVSNGTTTSNNNSRSRRDSISETGVSGGSSSNNNAGDIINNKDCSPPSGKVVEVDDFVIIPTGTRFSDVVSTVLTLLGYPKDAIRQAEGTICLRNWKPLKLSEICDSSTKTVGDILNDLTNHATLRVLVTRAKGGTAEDLKEKLLRLLLAHSSTLLMGAGAGPLDEIAMSQLVKGQWPQNLADDVKRRFDQWYKQQHPGTTMGLLESLQMQQQQQHSSPNSHTGSLMTSPHAGGGAIHHHHLVNGSSSTSGHHHHHHLHDLQSAKSGSFIEDDHNHPVFHGLATQKTRMRTSFDPEMELPKLQQWFAENPHPSRHQIQQYVRDLNMLDCRKDRKPLDVNNVIYWFKNARAAQKRNELRYNGLSPHHHPSYSHHHQQLNHHDHGIHSSHGMGDCRSGSSSSQQHQQQAMEMTNGDSGNEQSGGSSCRDSDQDGDMSKEHADSPHLEQNREGKDDSERHHHHHHSPDHRSSTAIHVKEERDDDYINVDGGVGSPRDIKHVITNNNEEPKDLSGKSPQVDSGEESLDEKPDVLDNTDHHHNNNNNNNNNSSCNNNNNSKDTNGSGKREKSEGITSTNIPATSSSSRNVSINNTNEDENGVEMRGGVDLVNENSNNSSSSVSPRSSPGLSPAHPGSYDFSGPPSMVSRFHPFFEHPSFMAYRHFNSFNFGPNFPNGDSSSAYEAALSATRKSLLPLGKLSSAGGAAGSGGLENIFHEFPAGLNPQLVISNGRNTGSGNGGMNSGGVNTTCDPLSRLRVPEELFPPRSASSADIISSIINSNRGEFSPLNLGNHHHHHNTQNSLALDERRKRNRTFIDPVTEVVLLENWFKIQTHPSHNLILKYTDELNRMPYRQKFPKLEPKNEGKVQKAQDDTLMTT